MSMKKRLWRIIAAAVLFIGGLLLERCGGIWYIAAFVAAYIIVGYDVVLPALRNILRGMVFDEKFLMTLATIGAFALQDYSEACAVMLFFQTGELFQSYAVNQSRRSIAQLMDIRPDFANVMREGQLMQVDPYDVAVGDLIVIKPGERIPLDAVVCSGTSALDTSALTGESAPRSVAEGDSLLSGCINLSGVLEARVTREFGESTVSKILDLVENASSKKSKQEAFITRFARYYTPAVVGVAAVLAVVPPLVLQAPFAEWLRRALLFLVVSCPCALVISIPMSFFGGIGGAARRGILVKGSNYLEALAKADTVVFDKTGTLTRGVFEVQEIRDVYVRKEDLLRLAAYAESFSDHPISQSLRRAYGRPIHPERVEGFTELAGLGVYAYVGGIPVYVGNSKLMEQQKVQWMEPQEPGTVVHLAAEGIYLGYIRIADTLKPDAADAIAQLRRCGIRKTVMLTGDSDAAGQAVAAQLGIDEALTQLLPQDKVARVEELLTQQRPGATLAFAGDGINDAPVLARADIGIAMGGLGSDAAIEAADVVIMTDEPSKIATAVRIARKTLRIAHQNIVFALAVKGAVLLLGALGHATMWEAVFADVGVAVIAILNALRALRTDDKHLSV